MSKSSSKGLRRSLSRWLSGSARRQGQYSYTEQLRQTYEDLSAYADVAALSSRRTPYPARHEIRCHPELPFGCSPGALARRFGRPQHQVRTPNGLASTIAAYRQQWSGHKVKSEFHFSRDGLFYFNQAFPYVSDAERAVIAQYFVDHYCAGTAFDLDEDKLVDGPGNEILFARAVVFSIHYLGAQRPALLRQSGIGSRAGPGATKDPPSRGAP